MGTNSQPGFRVKGLKLRVKGLGFRVLGFGVRGLESRKKPC